VRISIKNSTSGVLQLIDQLEDVIDRLIAKSLDAHGAPKLSRDRVLNKFICELTLIAE
jgi:hypothetical protein